jgi:hypothetical protein
LNILTNPFIPIMRECRVYQQVNQSINHIRAISGKNPLYLQVTIVRQCRVYQQEIQFINHMREIREKSCLAKGKLQAGNM